MKFLFFIIFIFGIGSQPSLKNTSWKLIVIQDGKKQYLYSHLNSILTITDSTYSLNTCTSMWGEYQVINNNEFKTKGIGSYSMNCANDNGEIQNYYIYHFNNLQYRINGDTLIFSNNNGIKFKFLKH